MIPGKILRFLDTSEIAIAGTCDENRVPRLHRASAWLIEPDGETLACAVPKNYTAQLNDNLRASGEFAMTASEVVSHETYQFKGEYIDSREVTPEDLALFEAIRERFVRAGGILFPNVPADILRAYLIEPIVVIRCKVREIFLQTPGPGAGTRLFPPRAK